MSTQQTSLLDLLDRPRSRRSDPPSSQRAEAQMRTSGAMRGQAAEALAMIKRNPGKSTKELGAIGPLERHQIARRTKELWQAGLVVTLEAGTKDVRYWAILGSEA